MSRLSVGFRTSTQLHFTQSANAAKLTACFTTLDTFLLEWTLRIHVRIEDRVDLVLERKYGTQCLLLVNILGMFSSYV